MGTFGWELGSTEWLPIGYRVLQYRHRICAMAHHYFHVQLDSEIGSCIPSETCLSTKAGDFNVHDDVVDSHPGTQSRELAAQAQDHVLNAPDNRVDSDCEVDS